MKICKKCGVKKPLNTIFFHKCKRMKDGFKSECKECRNIYNKQVRNHEKIKEYREKNKDEINKKLRDYRNKNIDYVRKQARGYYEKNKRYDPDYSKRYYEKNKDKIVYRAKRYYANNKERALINVKKYYQSDKGKQNRVLNRQKRKTRFNLNIATLTTKQWVDCKDYFNHCCAYCGESDKLEQEHFVPLSKGGEYTRKNIIPACKRCNSSKYNNSFFDWYPSYEFYSKKREKIILKYLGYENKKQQISLF